MNNEEITTKSAEGTRILGKKIAQKIPKGMTVLLYGDMGSGKTTFVQGFAEGLGITRRISSPTFIIMRTYEMKNDEQHVTSKRAFYHLDLYRTTSEKDLEGLGIQEIIDDPESIVVIEWPERMQKLPEKCMKIYFEYLSDDERKIDIHD